MKEIVELIKSKGIILFEMPTREVKAIAFLLGNQYFIGYDPTKFKNETEIEDALKHEYYHIITATLHKFNELIDVNEMAVQEMEQKWN